ncbi:MAG: hypothetical protein COA38_09100 [Fluviicola sp.]|nr:MAG: hypothetical protein COA38_09100 [Fluviicola sp.]
MKKLILLLAIALNVQFGFSQKEGSFLISDSPLDKLWESVDGKNGGAPMAGMPQQFFFLIADGSKGSMMAPFEMEDYGFACPTYFTISLDTKYLYLDINEPCELDLPEEKLFVKIGFKISDDGSRLTLIVDKEKFDYKEWKTD